MKTIIFAGLMIFSVSAQVLSPKDTLELSLARTIELAMKNNNDLRISKINSEIADEKVNEAWGSALYPDISGSVNYRKALKRGVFNIETPFFSGTFPVGTDHTMTASVNVEQTLFSGAAFIAIRIAKSYSEIAGKFYLSAKNELKVKVKEAYYSHLLAKEVVNLTKQNLTLAEDNLKNTQSLYRAGMISEYDLVRAGVQVQNMIPELQAAEHALSMSENFIKLLTGIPFEEAISIRDSLVFSDQKLEEFDGYFERVIKMNPYLNGLELDTRMKDDVVTARFAQHFPTLTATGGWQTEAQENNGRAFADWRYNASSFIGINLRVPIFKGFQTSAVVEQAKLDHQMAIETYEKTKKQLGNQLLDLLGTIEKDKQRISAYSATINQADLAYSIAQKRFSSGLSTQLEVLDAMVSLTRSKVNYLTALYDYYIANAKLEQLIAKD
ncbi:MAG: TolC family protein [Ignavibacteriaceae bacterium]|nr:TolC family protein [Ignavibacteriaceae bacterium]